MPEAEGPIDWARAAKDYYGAFQHPFSASLSVADFPTAVKLATATKFGGHASAAEADAFHREFVELGIEPEQYLHRLDQMSPLSFRLHGRPPTMREIGQAHEEKWDSARARAHYAALPDSDYPDITAGEMAAALTVAEHYSLTHLDRRPIKVEARMIHHGKLAGSAVADYYKEIKNGVHDDTLGQDGSGRGPEAAGGRPAGGGPGDPGMGRQERPAAGNDGKARD